VLAVIVNDRLTASDHVSNLLESCRRLLYAFRVLHTHGLGLPSVSLQDVFCRRSLQKSCTVHLRGPVRGLLLGSGSGPVRWVPHAM